MRSDFAASDKFKITPIFFHRLPGATARCQLAVRHQTDEFLRGTQISRSKPLVNNFAKGRVKTRKAVPKLK